MSQILQFHQSQIIGPETDGQSIIIIQSRDTIAQKTNEIPNRESCTIARRAYHQSLGLAPAFAL